MNIDIGAITFDCRDAADLATFWSALLGRTVDDGASSSFATISRTSGVALMFVEVPEPKATKNRVHLDLHAPDWKDEVERAVALGATHVADFDEEGTAWATLLDPEGNEFDIAAG